MSGTQGTGTSAPIEFGQFRLRPQLFTSYIQANDLPSGVGSGIDSQIFTFSPGLTAELGEHWIINYTPSWVNYSAVSLRDSTNQNFRINGAATLGNWAVQFTEGYQASTDFLVETAQQTKQHSWLTQLSASRKVGNRSTYEASASLNERYGETLSDSRTWATQHWLKSQFSPRLNAGVGVGLGYVDILHQADMKYEEYLGQIDWHPTTKLNFSIQGGLENRHSETAGAEAIRSPSLDISLAYRPFEHTSFTATSFRRISNSYFDDTVTKSKGWSVGLNQRLLEKLNLGLSYNHQTGDYDTFAGSAASTSSVVGRTDDSNSFNSTLSVTLFQRWTLSAVYQTSKNVSEQSGLALASYSFSTSQYGLELSGRF